MTALKKKGEKEMVNHWTINGGGGGGEEYDACRKNNIQIWEEWVL